MNGKIFNIQRCCTGDGPGIRTTVFLKGCPLRCIWCHNPESQGGENELLYSAEKCVNCLRCVGMCAKKCHTADGGMHRFDRKACIACGSCVSPLCEALESVGYEMTADAVLETVLRDRPFYESSGGGLTLSGGEPLAQTAFCAELLEKAKANSLHVCVETCGFADPENLEKLAPFVDIFLFDYKETDPERHRRYTGADNHFILENLRRLDAMGKSISLRCPIIPGVNDREEHFCGIATLANSLSCITEVAIEPYHAFGEGKYRRLGREYALSGLSAPDPETTPKWIMEIQKHTNTSVRLA